MELVRHRQQERSARAFHAALLAEVERAMRCHLRGYPGAPGVYGRLRAMQRALAERMSAEDA